MVPEFDLSRINVCIFDVNGVLIDSNRANAQAMGKAFSGDEVTRQRIASFYLQLTGIDRATKIRMIQEKIIGRPFGEGEFEKRWENFRELAASAMSYSPLANGCLEVLDELGKRKMKRAALSNTPEPELRRILAAQELDTRLDIIRGGGNWPKSESLSRFLTEFAFDPSGCIFIGDGKGDLVAAKHAEVQFFAIDPGMIEFTTEEGFFGPFRDLAEWSHSFLGI